MFRQQHSNQDFPRADIPVAGTVRTLIPDIRIQAVIASGSWNFRQGPMRQATVDMFFPEGCGVCNSQSESSQLLQTEKRVSS